MGGSCTAQTRSSSHGALPIPQHLPCAHSALAAPAETPEWRPQVQKGHRSQSAAKGTISLKYLQSQTSKTGSHHNCSELDRFLKLFLSKYFLQQEQDPIPPGTSLPSTQPCSCLSHWSKARAEAVGGSGHRPPDPALCRAVAKGLLLAPTGPGAQCLVVFSKGKFSTQAQFPAGAGSILLQQEPRAGEGLLRGEGWSRMELQATGTGTWEW